MTFSFFFITLFLFFMTFFFSSGGASGGTIASVLNMFDTATTSGLMKLSDPFYLNPRDGLTNEPARATGKSTLHFTALNRYIVLH